MLGSAQTTATSGDPQQSHPPANINTPHQLVITGCLRRDSRGTYFLTSENGKRWNLIAGSDTVDLSKHVFHAVRITGKEAPSATSPGTADNSQSQVPPVSVLRVLTLEVLSNSCTR
jgi:hypothetical protein